MKLPKLHAEGIPVMGIICGLLTAGGLGAAAITQVVGKPRYTRQDRWDYAMQERDARIDFLYPSGRSTQPQVTLQSQSHHKQDHH